MIGSNVLNLYLGHLRSSKRILILSSIGLILALTIFSSTAFYVDNSKKQILDNFFEEQKAELNPDISIDLRFSLDQEELTNDNRIDSLIQSTAEELDINYFKNITIQSAISDLFIGYLDIYQYIEENITEYYPQDILMVELTPEFEKELLLLQKTYSLITDSTLPIETSSNDQVYLLTSYLDEIYDKEGNFIGNPLNLYNSSDQISIFNSYELTEYVNVTVTGASLWQEYYYYDNYGNQNQKAKSFEEDFPNLILLRRFQYSQYILFTPDLEKFTEKILNLDSVNSNIQKIESRSIFLDWDKIDVYNTGPLLKQIERFQEKLYSKYYDNYNVYQGDLNIHFQSRWILSQAASIANAMIYSLLIISLPVIIITVFVTNYSFGLVHKNIIRQIGIFKTRGANSNMIFLFQLIDSIFVMIFSIFAGTILGLPLTYMILKSDFLLSFNYPPLEFYIFNFQAIGDLLIYSAVFITLITNGNRVKKLARLSIFESENPSEKSEPSWKRHYWDVILTGYGLVFFTLIYLISKDPELVYSIGPLISILFLLAMPSPFALIIGIILLCNRAVPLILNKIGTQLWIKTGDLIAFAFKNVIRHQQASTRAVMLMATLIAFVIAFYSLPLSGIVYNEQTLYYRYGADASASFGGNDFLNQTDINMIESNFTQYFDSYSPYMIINSDSFSIMLINTTTYLQTTYPGTDYGFQRNSLSNNLNTLAIENENASSINIIVDQGYLENYQYKIGESFSVFSYKGTNSTTQNVVIKDSFRNFPILKSENFWNTNTAVADLQLYTLLLNRSFIDSPFYFSDSGMMFNFKSGVNQTQIMNLIEQNTTLSFNGNVFNEQQEYIDGTQLRLQIGQINNNVIMTFAISITVLIMFSYLQLTERKRELYTERALGMKLIQISVLFFIETMVLTFTSVVLGTTLGVVLMQMLSLFITQSATYPSYAIILPIDLIALTNIILILLSLMGSLIPAYFVTKQDISKGFAGEM